MEEKKIARQRSKQAGKRQAGRQAGFRGTGQPGELPAIRGIRAIRAIRASGQSGLPGFRGILAGHGGRKKFVPLDTCLIHWLEPPAGFIGWIYSQNRSTKLPMQP